MMSSHPALMMAPGESDPALVMRYEVPTTQLYVKYEVLSLTIAVHCFLNVDRKLSIRLTGSSGPEGNISPEVSCYLRVETLQI